LRLLLFDYRLELALAGNVAVLREWVLHFVDVIFVGDSRTQIGRVARLFLLVEPPTVKELSEAKHALGDEDGLFGFLEDVPTDRNIFHAWNL